MSQLNQSQLRRPKRKRQPTFNGRFGNSSIALEIALIRMTMGMEREAERILSKERESK